MKNHRTQRTRCPICNSAAHPDHQAYLELALDQAPMSHRIYRCESCGLRWMTPYPKPEDYQEIYDRNYYESEQAGGPAYRHEKAQLTPCYEQITDRFHSFGVTCRLLDIGCGTGDFLRIARDRRNITGIGIEPSRYAAQKAAESGIQVFHGTLNDFVRSNRNAYRAASCHHVLEHVPDVHEFMKNLVSVLEPGAPLYLEVPIQFDGILDTINRVRRRRRPFSIHSIHHHYFYTPRAVSKILETYDFRIISLATHMPCRRFSRKPGVRKWTLQAILKMADRLAQRGDVISVWARLGHDRDTSS